MTFAVRPSAYALPEEGTGRQQVDWAIAYASKWHRPPLTPFEHAERHAADES
jgi:hypothetical protein